MSKRRAPRQQDYRPDMPKPKREPVAYNPATGTEPPSCSPTGPNTSPSHGGW